jgi:hypothetical protein
MSNTTSEMGKATTMDAMKIIAGTVARKGRPMIHL